MKKVLFVTRDNDEGFHPWYKKFHREVLDSGREPQFPNSLAARPGVREAIKKELLDMFGRRIRVNTDFKTIGRGHMATRFSYMSFRLSEQEASRFFLKWS